MSYGLTAYGLDIPNLSEWLDEYNTLARNTYGTDINLSDSSLVSKLFGIFAYQDMKMWNVLQGVYSSQTLTGAEGIYLDEVLGRRGVFRKAATYSKGYATIKTGSAADWGLTVDSSYTFVTNKDNQYKPTKNQTLSDRISAYSISKTEAVAAGASLTFYIANVNTGLVVSQTFTTAATTFLVDLQTFFKANLALADQSLVIIDNNTLYVGYVATDDVSEFGLYSPTKIYCSKNVGTKYSDIYVQAVATGKIETLTGDIVSMTPTVTFGYLGVTNFADFDFGSEIETDAEYRDRFNTEVDEAVAATRGAIYKAVLDLSEVDKVKIYDNPTSTPTAQAGAFSFNTVVIGGASADIAQAIYTTKPINTLTDGTTSVIVNTEDASTETIKFTYGSQVPYTIKIVYTTTNGTTLSADEISTINDNIIALSANFEIGGQLFNAQLQSAVFGAIGFSRLSNLIVHTKKTSASDSTYTTNNVVSAFNESMIVDTDNILYEQTF